MITWKWKFLFGGFRTTYCSLIHSKIFDIETQNENTSTEQNLKRSVRKTNFRSKKFLLIRKETIFSLIVSLLRLKSFVRSSSWRNVSTIKIKLEAICLIIEINRTDFLFVLFFSRWNFILPVQSFPFCFIVCQKISREENLRSLIFNCSLSDVQHFQSKKIITNDRWSFLLWIKFFVIVKTDTRFLCSASLEQRIDESISTWTNRHSRWHENLRQLFTR